ncbi:CHLG [Symbiodinium microadriaticum]|nr:CHLG [Symbiodinium microadriaticum]
MHYGHPDIMNKAEYMMQQGGVSKATKTLNLSEVVLLILGEVMKQGVARAMLRVHTHELVSVGSTSEDIFAGMDFVLRGGGFKVSVPEMVPPWRFYYAHMGHYLSQWAVSWGLPVLTLVWLLILLNGCEDSNDLSIKCSAAGQSAASVMAEAWQYIYSGNLLIVFLLAQMAPIFFEVWMQAGLVTSIIRLVKQLLTLSPIMFIFQAKVIGFYTMNELKYGGATYAPHSDLEAYAMAAIGPAPHWRRPLLRAALCAVALGAGSAGFISVSTGRAAPSTDLPKSHQVRPATGDLDSSSGSSLISASAAGSAALPFAMLAVLAARSQSRHRSTRRAEEKKGSLQQLLGMKGASETDDEPLWKIRLQLCKPVTWPPLIFGVIAGVCASGNFDWSTAGPEEYAKFILCVTLSGPVLVGYTQTLNDWYDKDLDAINEPYRPIPSGRITEEEVWQQIYVLGGLGLGMAAALDIWQGHWPPTVFAVAVVGVFMAYIYSAPPLKLKQNWISGCYALGSSYIALPWLAGQCTFGQATPEIIALTLWYSVAAVGIAIVNDFKSVEGDAKLGLSSAPVVFGVDTAKYMAPIIKDSVQLTIVGYLLYIGETNYALGLLALILPQIYFAKTLFLEDPIKNDVKYQGSSLPFFSIGTIVAASAIGNNPLH